jgi:hypothetical protein
MMTLLSGLNTYFVDGPAMLADAEALDPGTDMDKLEGMCTFTRVEHKSYPEKDPQRRLSIEKENFMPGRPTNADKAVDEEDTESGLYVLGEDTKGTSSGRQLSARRRSGGNNNNEEEERTYVSSCWDEYDMFFITEDPDYTGEYKGPSEALQRNSYACKERNQGCQESDEFQDPCAYDYNCDHFTYYAQTTCVNNDCTATCSARVDERNRKCGYDTSDDEFALCLGDYDCRNERNFCAQAECNTETGTCHVGRASNDDMDADSSNSTGAVRAAPQYAVGDTTDCWAPLGALDDYKRGVYCGTNEECIVFVDPSYSKAAQIYQAEGVIQDGWDTIILALVCTCCYGACAGGSGKMMVTDNQRPTHAPSAPRPVAPPAPVGVGIATPAAHMGPGGWKGPCGTQNPDSARFCTGCGTPKPTGTGESGGWTGPCGTQNPDSARFCTGCGTAKPH